MCRRKPENGWRQVWSQPVLAGVIKATAAIGAGKLTDRDGLTHHDGHHGIIEQQAIPDEAPQPLFDGPQVGCLPHKGRAIHSSQQREKCAEFRLWTALAQALAFRRPGPHLVNETETCDNKIGLPSWHLSSETCNSSEGSRLHEPFLCKKNLHVGRGFGGGRCRAQSSAHCFLHEGADPCLVGGGQLRQSEGGRPHGAFVEVRLVAEAERRVPRLELLRALEEADDVAVLGIRGHPVPESGREGWRAGFDDRMEPLAHGAIRFRHLGDLREHGAFPVRLVRARAAARGRLQLLDALLHRGSFLVRESLGRLADRGGALGGLLRVLHWRFPPLRRANAMCHFLSCTSPLQPLSLRRCIYSRDVQKLWQVSESCTSR